MSGKEDYVLRPVRNRMCLYESVVNGTLDLIDIAVMNESIDVENENRDRVAVWVKKHHGR